MYMYGTKSKNDTYAIAVARPRDDGRGGACSRLDLLLLGIEEHVLALKGARADAADAVVQIEARFEALLVRVSDHRAHVWERGGVDERVAVCAGISE